MVLDDKCRCLLMENGPLVDKPIVIQYAIYMYKHRLLLYDNFPHFNFLGSHEPPSDLVTKLHCIIITCKVNLYTFLTVQLCMCSMEKQDRKIHRVTMINCSTMLLAGLCFGVIILSNGWLW